MELEKCINERRSIRKYKSDTLSNETILQLIDAAQKAPSWKNTQVSKFYVANSEKNKESVFNYLPKFNQNNTLNASAYIVSTIVNGICGFNEDGSYSSHLKDGFQFFDNGLAVENLCLKAHDMGLGTLIMGLYDEEQIRKLFNIPSNETIVCVISVGTPDINPVMPKRKPISEVITII